MVWITIFVTSQPEPQTRWGQLAPPTGRGFAHPIGVLKLDQHPGERRPEAHGVWFLLARLGFVGRSSFFKADVIGVLSLRVLRYAELVERRGLQTRPQLRRRE